MAAKNSVSAVVIKIFILLSKLKKRAKKMKLVEQQYSYYGYMKEYKSSPSMRRMSEKGLKKLRSNVVLICSCFRVEEYSNCWSEEDSVDERAERFIQSFYRERRRERDESGFQLLLQI